MNDIYDEFSDLLGAYALDAVDPVDAFEELDEGGDAAGVAVVAAAVAGDDLAEEGDFADTACGEGTGKRQQPGLVADGEQGAADRDEVRHQGRSDIREGQSLGFSLTIVPAVVAR